jgi:hypothetical protein
MSFNKHFPDAPEASAPDDAVIRLRRARVLRLAWLASTLMLVTGYVLVALVLTGRL